MPDNSDFPDFESFENSIKKEKGFDFNKFLTKNFLPLAVLLVGVTMLGFGIFFGKTGMLGSGDKVEVITADEGVGEVKAGVNAEIVVELAGAVEQPNVYKLPGGSRISDLLIAGGGLAGDADRVWVEKYINKVAVLSDGQKVYIPSTNEQSNSESANFGSSSGDVSGSVSGMSTSGSGLVNINTASLSELDKLPGIGPVYGQNIIEQRPYSSVGELLTKKVLRKDVFEKIKDKVGVY